MSYQVKTEDLTKVISLTLTAEQLETIAGALEMYCIGLAEHNDTHLKYAADAQEVVINNLEWHFGETKEELNALFNELVELTETGNTEQLNPFFGTNLEKDVIRIGHKIKDIGGVFSLGKTEELFDAIYHGRFKGAFYRYWGELFGRDISA